EPHRPSADSWWRWLAPVVATRARPQAVGPASLAAQAVRSVRELPPLMMPSAVDNGRAQPALVDDLAVRLGQAVHRVLEWATGPVPNTDLDRLARAALQELRAPAVAAERVVSVVRAILNSAPCRRFFDRSALRWAGNEVVVCDGDEILRIDRLVACHEAGAERGDVVQWWVLDYKLNHEPEALGAYRAQLRRYRDLVRAMQAQANVRAAFITGRGELIEPDLERAADR
ncbi:MAG: PD-(D/E)XK nuclease family protein, partial [Burkholderiales bacterium]